MSLLGLLIVLIIIGVVLWLINTYIPMDDKIKKIINIITIVLVVIWILSRILGPYIGLEHIRV